MIAYETSGINSTQIGARIRALQVDTCVIWKTIIVSYALWFAIRGTAFVVFLTCASCFFANGLTYRIGSTRRRDTRIFLFDFNGCICTKISNIKSIKNYFLFFNIWKCIFIFFANKTVYFQKKTTKNFSLQKIAFASLKRKQIFKLLP